eukprot:gene13946-29681_t
MRLLFVMFPLFFGLVIITVIRLEVTIQQHVTEMEVIVVNKHVEDTVHVVLQIIHIYVWIPITSYLTHQRKLLQLFVMFPMLLGWVIITVMVLHLVIIIQLDVTGMEVIVVSSHVVDIVHVVLVHLRSSALTRFSHRRLRHLKVPFICHQTFPLLYHQ